MAPQAAAVESVTIATAEKQEKGGKGSRMSLILPWLLATLAGGAAWKWQESQQRTISLNGLTPPPQSVIIDPLSYAVLGTQGPFRDADSWTTFFNPTSTAPPFFQILHPDFLSVLGPAPSLRAIASNRDFAFAHEAPIWVPASDEVFFASNAGGPLGFSDWNTNNQVAKISMRDVERAVARAGSNVSAVNVSVQKLYLPDTIQMTNGGTGPFRGSLLLINSGRATMPPNLVLVNAYPPHNATVLLDNYFGRQFNSLNDVRVHPKGKAIFFTDVTYGWLNHFRPPPLLPNQVYRFDPDTGHVRVVADGFMRCNGLAFSKDGKTVYIADSGAAAGFLGRNTTQPSTIYAFDVEPKSQVFLNRRVFAYVDAGVPDGLQVDTAGNVYSGCADGVHVWNKEGTLIGKFFLGAESANLVFAGKGKLVMLAETVVYLAQIAADGVNLAVD